MNIIGGYETSETSWGRFMNLILGDGMNWNPMERFFSRKKTSFQTQKWIFSYSWLMLVNDISPTIHIPTIPLNRRIHGEITICIYMCQACFRQSPCIEACLTRRAKNFQRLHRPHSPGNRGVPMTNRTSAATPGRRGLLNRPICGTHVYHIMFMYVYVYTFDSFDSFYELHVMSHSPYFCRCIPNVLVLV